VLLVYSLHLIYRETVLVVAYTDINFIAKAK
jgi:hypothetical protein